MHNTMTIINENDKYQCSSCDDLCSLLTGKFTSTPKYCVKGYKLKCKWREINNEKQVELE